MAIPILIPLLLASQSASGVATDRSYQAHVAAAEMALRLGDAGAARHWLERAPETGRGWEWKFLAAASDMSSRAVTGHEGGVTCVAHSPDGRRLATGGDDGRVRLWKAATLEPERSIDAHAREVFSLDWSADGTLVASSGGDAKVRILDAASGEVIRSFEEHSYPVGMVRFSPDDSRLASCSYERPVGGEVRVWSTGDGTRIARLQDGYAPITCVEWSRDGGRILAGSWDQTFKIWSDLAGETKPIVTRLGSEDRYRPVEALALSPDGRIAALGSKDEEVHVFDAETGAAMRALRGHSKAVEGVAFSPDGSLLASGSVDRSVRLWDVATGAERARLSGHASTVRGLSFSPDGQRLVTGSSDGTLREWDVNAILARRERFELGAAVYDLAISPDGATLAAGLDDGRVVLLDSDDGAVLQTLGGDAGWIAATDFTADGALVLGAGESSLRVWRVATGELVSTCTGGQKGCDGAAFSPDGTRFVAGARDRTARVYDVETGDQIASFEHPREVGAVAFAPSGSEVATGCRDGRVRVFALGSSAPRLEFAAAKLPISRLLYSPDGTRLVTAGDGGLDLWSAVDGKPLGRLDGHDAGVRGLAFHPDGRRLATGSADETLIVWDLATREPLLRLEIGGRVAHLHFSRDGTRLAVDPGGEHVRLLDSVPLRERLAR